MIKMIKPDQQELQFNLQIYICIEYIIILAVSIK